MNRKAIKVISFLMVVLMAVMTLAVPAFATDSSWKDISINTFDNASVDTTTSGIATNIVATIINIVQVVGMGVAIIMLVVMAIKYISAAPSEKADIKKGATIYIVGAIVLFAASGILQIIKNFAGNTINKAADSAATSALNVIEMAKIAKMIYFG